MEHTPRSVDRLRRRLAGLALIRTKNRNRKISFVNHFQNPSFNNKMLATATVLLSLAASASAGPLSLSSAPPAQPDLWQPLRDQLDDYILTTSKRQHCAQ